MTINAVIAYHNVLSEESVTASSEAVGFEKDNAYDGLPVDFWKPTSSPAWIKTTGRMPSGMWMGSTTPGQLDGGDKVQGGDMTSTASWLGLNATLSIVSGALRVTSVFGGVTDAQQTLTGLIIGQTYTVTGTYVTDGMTGQLAIKMGITPGDISSGVTFITTVGTYELTFTATQTTHYLSLGSTSLMAIGEFFDWDNVTMPFGLVDDLSTNDNNLNVNGSTITASPVANAAQLMGYSNWSFNNYLSQEYRAIFDRGVADWSWSGWVKKTTFTSSGIIFSRGAYSGTWSGASIKLFIGTAGELIGEISDDGLSSSDTITSTRFIDDGLWHYVTFQRSGTDLELFIDAAPAAENITITNAAGSLDNVSATIRFGISQSNGTVAFDASFALWRTYDHAQTQTEILADMTAETGWLKTNSEVDEILISHAATTADYFAIYGHDFAGSGSSVVLQYSDDDSAWTDAFHPIFPATSAPICKLFSRSAHKYWRIFVTGVGEQQIGVAMFGQRLNMQRGLGTGFEPMALGSENEPINSESSNGDFIGRSLKKRPMKAILSFSNLTPSWIRTNWQGLLNDLETRPFFVLPAPADFPDESVYCWTVGVIQTPKYGGSNLMSASLRINARIT